jgi:hypothetical protein
MRKQIAALAERGAPNVSGLIEHSSGEVIFTDVQRQTLARGEHFASVAWSEPDALAFTVWLHQSAIVKALEVEIDAEADNPSALDDKARASQIETINRDLAAVEAEESALVWAALDQGVVVEHRPDVSPAALLGISVTERVEQPA